MQIYDGSSDELAFGRHKRQIRTTQGVFVTCTLTFAPTFEPDTASDIRSFFCVFLQ